MFNMSQDDKILNQSDIVRIISEKTDVVESDVKKVVDSLWSTIHGEIETGTIVRFQGVGRFYLTERKERRARNMHTGEEMIIDEHLALRFSPSRTYAKRLRNKRLE